MTAQETTILKVLFKRSVGFGTAKTVLVELGFPDIQSRPFGNLVLCETEVPTDEVENCTQRIKANRYVATVEQALRA